MLYTPQSCERPDAHGKASLTQLTLKYPWTSSALLASCLTLSSADTDGRRRRGDGWASNSSAFLDEAASASAWVAAVDAAAAVDTAAFSCSISAEFFARSSFVTYLRNGANRSMGRRCEQVTL